MFLEGKHDSSDCKEHGERQMSSGKDKSARTSRIKTLMDKWRTEYAHLSNSDLYEIQEVIENILDERFYARRNQ